MISGKVDFNSLDGPVLWTITEHLQGNEKAALATCSQKHKNFVKNLPELFAARAFISSSEFPALIAKSRTWTSLQGYNCDWERIFLDIANAVKNEPSFTTTVYNSWIRNEKTYQNVSMEKIDALSKFIQIGKFIHFLPVILEETDNVRPYLSETLCKAVTIFASNPKSALSLELEKSIANNPKTLSALGIDHLDFDEIIKSLIDKIQEFPGYFHQSRALFFWAKMWVDKAVEAIKTGNIQYKESILEKVMHISERIPDPCYRQTLQEHLHSLNEATPDNLPPTLKCPELMTRGLNVRQDQDFWLL